MKQHLDNFKGVNWKHEDMRKTLAFLLPLIAVVLFVSFVYRSITNPAGKED